MSAYRFRYLAWRVGNWLASGGAASLVLAVLARDGDPLDL